MDNRRKPNGTESQEQMRNRLHDLEVRDAVNAERWRILWAGMSLLIGTLLTILWELFKHFAWVVNGP